MKVAIAGYDVEGRATYDYARQVWPAAEIVIADERRIAEVPPGVVDVLTGPDAFAQLGDADIVMRTPGLAPWRIETDGTVWSATNEFFARCPAPIIGVTGTKGKGTTVSLIAAMLQALGRTVHVVGNIGQPALAQLGQISPDDVVVYELSSFQLWDAERSPQIAVVLMIEPDHLDKHVNFAEYVDAKANIRRHQRPGDVCIYHPSNPYAAQIAESLDTDVARGSLGTPPPAYRYGTPDDGMVYVKDDAFWQGERRLCTTDRLQLPGAHNIENACAALSAVLAFDPQAVPQRLAEGLASFAGLPHRLAFVAEQDEVRYYDDSIATTPGSAIAALRAFAEPKVLIVGGADKGGDYEPLAQEVYAQGESVRAIITMGANASAIAAVLQNYDVAAPIITLGSVSMTEVVAAARQQAKPGDVVILSPAAASFDQYRSYADRGEQFIAAVQGGGA